LRKRPQDPEGFPKAICVSALQEDGLAAAWDEMRALIEWRRAEGHFAARRAAQAQSWFIEEVREGLLARLEAPQARAALERYSRAVAEGKITPAAAATGMLETLGR
jgi:LAO/AO transport system kinase